MNNNKLNIRKTQLFPNTRLGTAEILVPNQEKWALDDLKYGIPPRTKGLYRKAFANLNHKGIGDCTIEDLFHLKLLYEDENGNMVFINITRDAAEVRGTNSYVEQPFILVYGEKSGNCWYFQSCVNPDTAYICSSPIDCLSLYQILDQPAYYICTFGAKNQKSIDIIKEAHIPNTILAVNNNKTGIACRERNRDLPCICPQLETWNEDLQNNHENPITIP